MKLVNRLFFSKLDSALHIVVFMKEVVEIKQQNLAKENQKRLSLRLEMHLYSFEITMYST